MPGWAGVSPQARFRLGGEIGGQRSFFRRFQKPFPQVRGGDMRQAGLPLVVARPQAGDGVGNQGGVQGPKRPQIFNAQVVVGMAQALGVFSQKGGGSR